MFLDGLDELDQKIIRLLMKNARMSYSEIGEKWGSQSGGKDAHSGHGKRELLKNIQRSSIRRRSAGLFPVF